MTRKKARWWLESIVRNHGGSLHREALAVIFAEPAKSRPTVRRVRPRNSASTKFPLDELKRYRELFSHSRYCDYDNSVGASAFVDFIERKLRAGG